MIPPNWDQLTEYDQIIVPTSTGYKPYNILTLVSTGRKVLESIRGAGMAPLHFLEQRGPYQDGSTPLDMRWDNRVVQIAITESFPDGTGNFDRRCRVVDLLSRSRTCGVVIRPSGYQ